MRPASIVSFERFYFLYLISSLLMGALYFNREVQKLAAVSSLQNMAPIIVGGSILIGAAIVLLLWYFAARRGSALARWLILAQFLFALSKMTWNVASGRLLLGNGLLQLIMLGVLGAAVWFLFRPDARSWNGSSYAGEAI